jgi:hypothetical protein
LLRDTALEIGLLVFGTALIAGRFSWGIDSPFAVRNFATSAFFFIIFFATYRFILVSFIGDRNMRLWLTSAVFVICSLPHHLLGLDRFYYHLSHKVMTDWRDPIAPISKIRWFPGATLHLPTIPYEFPFFGFLLVFGALLIWRLFRQPNALLSPRIAILVWFVILLQAWIHLSMRSPYTYIPHFEQPASNHYWYHYFLFPNGLGAVNLDYHHFRPGEELFLGVNHSVAPLLGRTFPGYLVMQFGAFVNPMYAWLSLNCMSWFLAVVAVSYLASSFFTKRAGLFSACLMASAQGVIVYVGQAKPYTMAICGIAILVASLHWFASRTKLSYAQCCGIGGIFGLFLLCYEAQPWLIAVPFLAVSLGAPWKKAMFITLVGFIISRTFLYLCGSILNMNFQVALAPGSNPIASIFELLASGNILAIWRRTFDTVHTYGWALGNAFQLTALIAIPMIILMRDRRAKLFLGILFLPGITTFWMFMLAKSFYTEFPRLVYSAYPAVYILGGAALARLELVTSVKNRNRFFSRIAWGIVMVNFIYLNIDAWGFPQIYYRWFYRTLEFHAD